MKTGKLLLFLCILIPSIYETWHWHKVQKKGYMVVDCLLLQKWCALHVLTNIILQLILTNSINEKFDFENFITFKVVK